MSRQLPMVHGFDAFIAIDLDTNGRLLDSGVPVPPAHVPQRLESMLAVPNTATDVFVFVHGWQHNVQSAARAAGRLFAALWAADRTRYGSLDGFRPCFVAVRWPSRSSPLPSGYRRIRDRAHAMTTRGHAAHVIATLLGYLALRHKQPPKQNTLRTAGGKYLHCVGHSFGCRFLCEAIKMAAEPPPGPTLEWKWPLNFPFAVDSFVGFQMAAPPDIFVHRFRALIEGTAPIGGPVVLTFSPHDRALSMWHRFPEGVAGIGAVGARGAHTLRMHGLEDDYIVDDFAKLTNVDAGWRFRRGAFSMQGAHSDIWWPESIHLLLSLASLSRVG